MALRDEYYLRFHSVLVIRRAPFSTINADQVFRVEECPAAVTHLPHALTPWQGQAGLGVQGQSLLAGQATGWLSSNAHNHRECHPQGDPHQDTQRCTRAARQLRDAGIPISVLKTGEEKMFTSLPVALGRAKPGVGICQPYQPNLRAPAMGCYSRQFAIWGSGSPSWLTRGARPCSGLCAHQGAACSALGWGCQWGSLLFSAAEAQGEQC